MYNRAPNTDPPVADDSGTTNGNDMHELWRWRPVDSFTFDSSDAEAPSYGPSDLQLRPDDGCGIPLPGGELRNR